MRGPQHGCGSRHINHPVTSQWRAHRGPHSQQQLSRPATSWYRVRAVQNFALLHYCCTFHDLLMSATNSNNAKAVTHLSATNLPCIAAVRSFGQFQRGRNMLDIVVQQADSAAVAAMPESPIALSGKPTGVYVRGTVQVHSPARCLRSPLDLCSCNIWPLTRL